MEPTESRQLDHDSPGGAPVRSKRQPLICLVLSLICTSILVLFTDVEVDLLRRLRQPRDLERTGQLPRRIET